MLEIEIITQESFNTETEEFSVDESFVIHLEHSLFSVSKWEEKYAKPFFGKDALTQEDTLNYIECMIIDEDYPHDILKHLNNSHIEKINKYINTSHTATWFSDDGFKKTPTQTITSELIYYWMAAIGIPFECQHWAIDRLLVIIRIHNETNKKEKKLSRAELLERNRRLNEERKKKYNTTG